MKKIIIGVLVLVVAAAGVFFYFRVKSKKKHVQYTEVAAVRGDLTEKALAVGKIDPDHEIVIKSQVSGIVEKVHREVGEEVKKGEPLMVVKPEPTPLERAEARRQFELAELNRKYMDNELQRASKLYESKYIPGKDYEDAQRNMQESEVREKQAKERLELLEKGSSKIGDILVESVIRAPTDGMILERLVNVGDPVVPLTSYQPGTELMRLASMDDLIFVGTVDEIDVGKISAGMKAIIHIGAVASSALDGELIFISPKSRLKDNVVVFDIKIRILDSKGVKLRAGYSASADLIITEKKGVLYIPERLVEFKGDSTFVSLKAADADSLVKRPVKLGFSDGLSVEITEGLSEGEKVAEK
ncbi:efflux RND transporter periplasmic adaptor subunit [bacterium]|nr:efflux RND transporter periplasmic adaptor subunit [bacterium]